MDDTRQKQQRPSVLCHVSQTASRRQHESRAACFIWKREADAAQPSHLSSPQKSSSSQTGRLPHPLTTDPQSSGDSSLHVGFPQGTRSLFVNGVCRWPGCDMFYEDFSSFLKHLHSEHGHDDRSIAQWRVQQDIVQCMESQLIQEKQKLTAMQLHLSEHRHSYTPPVTDVNRDQRASTHLEEMVHHGYRATGSALVLPDLVSNIDCYKYHNIRPPYTYAHLIRWSILESPDKRRSLNEIYNWFSSKFFYFRHNTATWKVWFRHAGPLIYPTLRSATAITHFTAIKPCLYCTQNAVRHNLSLHKCFVRVEGGKGAVWIVDEREYQKRKSQKYYRDCPVKWFAPYSHYYDEDPSPSAAGLLASRGWS